MDGTRLAALSQRGYAIAAGHVGDLYDHYRPDRKLGPISDRSLRGVIRASFDRIASFPFTGQPKHSEPFRHAILGGLAVEHGDYLIRQDDCRTTLFIASPGRIHATLCIACNATLLMARVAPPEGVGAVGYRATAVSEVSGLERWPASIRQAGRGSPGLADLPGGVPLGDWTILLPRLSALPAIRNGDTLQDADGRRFAVLRAEASELGWRIEARAVGA